MIPRGRSVSGASSSESLPASPLVHDQALLGADLVSWSAVASGAVTAGVALVLLALLGLGIALTAIEWHAYREIVEAVIVWGGLSAIIASFVGGVVAGLASDRPRQRRLGDGAMVGVLVMIVIGVAVLTLALRWGDLASVGVELGYIPIPDDAPLVAPVPHDARVIPPDAVTFTVTASAWYGLAYLLMVVVAAVLGALSTVRLTDGQDSSAG